MKFKGILLAAVMVLPATAAAQTPSENTAKLEALFANAKQDGPGCAVGVTQDGQQLIQKTFGLADIERDVPITPVTMFEIGSVSKQFTAAAMLLLERDGKLMLSDDIRKYLPEMPDYKTPITIEMLLNHTSGLRDWGSVANAAGKPRGERTFSNTEVLDIAARQRKLNYKPGTEYAYTNTGYNLATIIVERVSGETLMAFTKERLFDPLGMTTAQWRDDYNRIVKNRALAYEPGADGVQQSMPFMNVYGNGGLMMTIADFTRWNEAMMADKLGLRAAMEKKGVLSNGHEIPYARGVEVRSYVGVPDGSVTEVSHSGSTGGYVAWLARYPERRISVAMVCNGPAQGISNLASGVPNILMGAAPAATSVAGSPDPSVYAGQFIDVRSGMPLTLSVDNGGFLHNGRPLTRLSDTRWRRDQHIYTFASPDRFKVDAADGNTYEYVRAPAVTLTARQLAEYAGQYISDEAMARYTVKVEDGNLKITTAGWPDGDATVSPSYKDAFTSGGFLVRFRREADGKINAVSFGDNRMRDLRARRVK